MENRNPIDDAMLKSAEVRFRQEISRAIANKPLSIIKPLKYNPGSTVWIESMNDTAKVQKGDIDVYLVRLKNGEFAVCRESDIKAIN